MNIDQILSFRTNSEFSINEEKEIFSRLGGEVPKSLSSLEALDRERVLKIIKDEKFNPVDELLAILFWGIYFKVVYKNPKKSFVEWLKQPSAEKEILKRKQAIIESDNPKELFKKFDYNGEFKIPGLSYAYFTKLFFFYRESVGVESYPIMDKWLSIAWVVIDQQYSKTPMVYENYFSNKDGSVGNLRRKKGMAYSEYTEFIHSLSRTYNVKPDQVEISLFGEDLGRNNSQRNPRVIYKKWLGENGLKI